MHFAIGRLFYEKNREMFLVPAKFSIRKIRNIEIRYMEVRLFPMRRQISCKPRDPKSTRKKIRQKMRTLLFLKERYPYEGHWKTYVPRVDKRQFETCQGKKES
ncbi:hypothetical protein TNCV_4041631 [Trichonephila clavipes]|nr:hypothetical protein TNCV_4041631 [Trichonephila clavipes]